MAVKDSGRSSVNNVLDFEVYTFPEYALPISSAYASHLGMANKARCLGDGGAVLDRHNM